MQNLLLKFFSELGEFAKKNKLEIYIVGGYVREKVLAEIQGKTFMEQDYRDIDLVVNSNAIKFVSDFFKEADFELLERTDFSAFKTIKIKVKGLEEYHIELASARKETYSHPSAFPEVELVSDIRQDLPRRDFTINALLISIMPENFLEIIDLVDGVDDLKNGLIKVFHDKSFIDDATRVYRAIRFKAKYGFRIEEHTLELMKECCQHPDYIKWKKKRKSQFEKEEIKFLSS